MAIRNIIVLAVFGVGVFVAYRFIQAGNTGALIGILIALAFIVPAWMGRRRLTKIGDRSDDLMSSEEVRRKRKAAADSAR